MNVSEPLALHARNCGNRPAIIAGERTVAYAELENLLAGAARWLVDQDLTPGQIVGVALRDSVEHLVALLAIARAGLVVQPVDWRWDADEQRRTTAHFGAALVLSEPGAGIGKTVTCHEVVDTWLDEVGDLEPLTQIPAGDMPYVMSLSSGTTGRPKGPQLSHDRFIARFRVFRDNLGFRADDTFLSATPLYYGGGRAFCLATLYAGGTVALFPPPHTAADLCAAVAQHRATALFLVPTQLRRVLDLDDQTLAPLRDLRVLVSSGAALHSDERRALLERVGTSLVQYYSSTEGGGVTYLTAADGPAHDESVGRAVTGVEVECVDDHGRPSAPGEIGHIRYRGPAVAEGFHNDPEATVESFRDGWFYPGDMGILDADGYLYLRGRSKDLIIRGGINIYPGDIEAVLAGHPSVREATVVGWPSREFNEEIAAFVIPSGPADPDALLEHCRTRLARYKWPRQVFVVEDFPRSALGKVVKAGLVDTLQPL